MTGPSGRRRTEQAITALIGDRWEEFVDDLVAVAHSHSARTREDYRLFVEAFRAGQIPGISSSGARPLI